MYDYIYNIYYNIDKSFFCQGFSEDLPHHTARIFAQARVASWAWHEMTKLSLKSKIRLYNILIRVKHKLIHPGWFQLC